MDQEDQEDASVSLPPAPPAPPFSDGRAVCVGTVGPLKHSWQRWSEGHQDQGPQPGGSQRGQPGYGRPPEGSLTEQRGREARAHIGREVEELCGAICSIGRRRAVPVSVEFGRLFQHYEGISNKLVGLLLRARKQRRLTFEGEMLWQGQHDGVLITLLP